MNVRTTRVGVLSIVRIQTDPSSVRVGLATPYNPTTVLVAGHDVVPPGSDCLNTVIGVIKQVSYESHPERTYVLQGSACKESKRVV